MSKIWEVAGIDDLEGTVFAQCTTEENAKKALGLLEQNGFENMLVVRESNLEIDRIEFGGKMVDLNKLEGENLTVKFEVQLEVKEKDLGELKKLEHHADYLLDLSGWPEIQSVHDCKVSVMKPEEILEFIFNEAIENGEDETDIYVSMLKRGIDVDYVRKYAGDKEADHMEAYCKDHGIL